MALLGKRKSLFYPPATELNGNASSRNALLRSHGMLKVNELCWTAQQKLIKVHHYALVSLYLLSLSCGTKVQFQHDQGAR